MFFLTVHELKQLVDDSLQEFPVCSEEARILADNVHDVGRYDGLVVLPSFLLAQAQQVLPVRGEPMFGLVINICQSEGPSSVSDLDDSDEEPLLIFLMHRPADGADGPAQHVEVPPGPLGAVHLVVELLGHDAFSVSIVQMGQIDCRHAHGSILHALTLPPGLRVQPI